MDLVLILVLILFFYFHLRDIKDEQDKEKKVRESFKKVSNEPVTKNKQKKEEKIIKPVKEVSNNSATKSNEEQKEKVIILNPPVIKKDSELEKKIRVLAEEFLNNPIIKNDEYIRTSFYEEMCSLYNSVNHFLSNTNLKLDKDYKEFLEKWEEKIQNREKYNEQYIEKKIKKYNELFSNVDNKSLDDQQRKAVVNDEDNQLIIAGAGSGKTLTIAGKVAYLVNVKGIKPEELLLITFTKKAADEMKERIVSRQQIPVNVATFHSLGRRLYTEGTQQKPSIEKSAESILKMYYNEVVRKDPKLCEKYLSYYGFSPLWTTETIKDTAWATLNSIYKPPMLIKAKYEKYSKKDLIPIVLYHKEYQIKYDYEKLGVKLNIEKYVEEKLKVAREEVYKMGRITLIDELIKIKKSNVSSRKDSLITDEAMENLLFKYRINAEQTLFDDLITYSDEKVRSVEELIIANFLFLNGVKYEYEKPYKYDVSSKEYRQYKPDFYLPEYDIYLEHFGIDKNGNPPSFYSEEERKKYIDGMGWKRKIHTFYGTKLIETYSYYKENNEFISKISETLKAAGVKLKPISDEMFVECYKIIESQEYFVATTKLFETFLNLFKANEYTLEGLLKKMQEQTNGNINYKEVLFFELFKDIYKFYENKLKEKYAIDFNDMITKSRKYLDKIPLNYKYIIIDEFQDTSVSRYKLVKAIKEKTGAAVMAVGDDWQSIYRFTGSDIDLFTNFEKYFGKTQITKIEKTYRNSQQMIDIAGKFVMQNSSQISKKLVSNIACENPVRIIANKSPYKKMVIVTNLIFDLLNKNPKKSIFLLGRYNTDINFLNESEFFQIEYDNTNSPGFITTDLYPKAKITFMSIHKSKGLEADDVIVLNNDDVFGKSFPSKIEDDPILKYVLLEKEAFLHAEERRLFYVALTRAKNTCTLLTPFGEQSIFIEELLKDKEKITYEEYQSDDLDYKIRCPKCNVGFLEVVQGEENKSYKCNNHSQCNFIYSKKKSTKSKSDIKYCKNCESEMKVQTNKKTGKKFYGCQNYPRCRYTANMD